MDVEAVCEHEHISGSKIGSNVLLVHISLKLVIDKDHDDISPLGSLSCGEDFKTLLYCSVPALGTLVKTDNDLASGLLKVKSVSMTLAAVSDNGNGLALEKGKVTIFLIKNLVSHKIIPPLINWLILNCVRADK